MVKLRIDLDKEEYVEAIELKGDKTWREILLEALGLEYTPRQLGRPPRNNLGKE